MGKKRGKSAKKARAALAVAEDNDLVKAPHSFVFHRGHVTTSLKVLIQDFRKIMEPFTASSLRASEKNSLKDFVSIAGPLNVSHFLMFGTSSTSANLRIMRLARGPTMSFKLVNFTLAKDVVSAQKRPNVNPKLFGHHPLLVLNGFGGQDGKPAPNHLKLISTMFQNMFPSININKVAVGDIRRCLLLRYDAETDQIYLRHYSIKAVPVGVSRRVRRMIQTRLPDMSGFNDVGDYLLNNGGITSESEGEMDGDHNQIDLPQSMPGRGNVKSQQSAIRLHELGPRLTLQLVKIEEGLCDGKVVHHSFIEKSSEELSALEKTRKEKLKIKEQRQKEQKQNIANKKKSQEEHKKKCLEGMSTEDGDSKEKKDEDGANDDDAAEGDDEEFTSDEDDAEYFRKEVGEEPEVGSFSKPGMKRRREEKPPMIPKRFKKKPTSGGGGGEHKKKPKEGNDSGGGGMKRDNNKKQGFKREQHHQKSKKKVSFGK